MARDIDKPEYPLPIDPVSGCAWWRFNMAYCLLKSGYREWQSQKSMSEIIPVLRWMLHGPIPEKVA